MGKAIGAAIGAKLGQPKVGAVLGGTLAAKMSRMVGRGDYDLADMPVHNSLVRKTGPRPSFGDDMMHQVRVRRREFIKNIVANEAAFSIDTIVVQPGLTEPFPYLSNLARCFAKYKFYGLVAEFVSNVSSYSSVPSMGATVMAFDPNQGAEPPSSKLAIENLEGAISSRPDHNIVMGIECADHLVPYSQYFVRSGDTPNVAGVAEDFGKLYVATAGLPASVYTNGTVLGELWISYDIVLDAPRLPTLEAGYLSYAAKEIATSSVLGSTVLGASKGGLLFDVEIVNDVLQLKNVPPGSILAIDITWSDNTGVDTFTPAISAYEGVTFLPLLEGPTGKSSLITSGSGTAVCTQRIALQVNATPPTSAGVYSPYIDWSLGGGIGASGDRVSLNVYTLGQGQDFAPY